MQVTTNSNAPEPLKARTALLLTISGLSLILMLFSPILQANQDLLVAARQQIGVTLLYDPSYQSLPYPNGDVPRWRGVCSDVVIRALRDARQLDLQQAVHRDIKAHWQQYPSQKLWRLTKPDPNIDHRRVANLMVYFQRQGYGLPLSKQARDYQPGDIVTWDLGNRTLHIGIVSDRNNSNQQPLIVHNIGWGTREDDQLFRFPVIGHYRLKP